MSNRAARRHPQRHQPRPSVPRIEAPKVVIAYISPGDVDVQFCASMVDMLLRDREVHRPPRILGHIALESGPRIVEARSQVVHHFLTAEAVADATHLLMIDSDMSWNPDALDVLLATMHEHQADVVGGLCFAGGHSDRVYPTVYRLLQEDDGMAGVEPVLDFPRDAPIKVGATGAAFMLVTRQILLRMTAQFGRTPDGTLNPYPWFVEGVNPSGRPFGEDVAFCMRVNALGGTVMVDPRVLVDHYKRRPLNLAYFDTVRQVTGELVTDNGPSALAPDALQVEHVDQSPGEVHADASGNT